MKLKKIRISNMDHPQALEFYNEILVFLHSVDTVPFEKLVRSMEQAVSRLNSSLLIYRRNFLIRQISLEQRNLQHNLMSLKYKLKRNRESVSQAFVTLSNKAIIILDHYYSSKHITVCEKDDKIFNLVDALEDFMTERELNEIGISPYLKSLKKINEKMKELIIQKNEIPVQETSHSLITHRQEADDSYRELISYLNILFKKNTHDKILRQIVEVLNGLILCQSEKIVSAVSPAEKIHPDRTKKQNFEVAS